MHLRLWPPRLTGCDATAAATRTIYLRYWPLPKLYAHPRARPDRQNWPCGCCHSAITTLSGRVVSEAKFDEANQIRVGSAMTIVQSEPVQGQSALRSGVLRESFDLTSRSCQDHNCLTNISTMGSLQEMERLLRLKDEQIMQLQKLLEEKEENIMQLRSKLDKFQSVLPQTQNNFIQGGPRKQRAQGISAEPQVLRNHTPNKRFSKTLK
ncbi:hypothetical protein RRG08_019624 [Elysia crispata]|uniref:cGMP-dependent protein kinase N-terminal coiled-coil domain-containing protein n=1 Tax=Elysia crispata TaxID=231223 RepID=A0AAE0ZSR3_9GAST|nr:hypothetical protein RRG08_019624 [Elysia crispata]